MTETRYGATEAGTVVLEIGADLGALVVYVPAGLAGREIEISPDREPARRTHACVRERRGAARIRYAAVYERLPPGAYRIWRDRVTEAATVTVHGGEVTSCEWPASCAGADCDASQ